MEAFKEGDLVICVRPDLIIPTVVWTTEFATSRIFRVSRVYGNNYRHLVDISDGCEYGNNIAAFAHACTLSKILYGR